MIHLTFNGFLLSNAIFYRLIGNFITHQHDQYQQKHTQMATLQQSSTVHEIALLYEYSVLCENSQLLQILIDYQANRW